MPVGHAGERPSKERPRSENSLLVFAKTQRVGPSTAWIRGLRLLRWVGTVAAWCMTLSEKNVAGVAVFQANKQSSYVAIEKTGYELTRDPMLNKGTAFTERERTDLRLRGLLPSEILTIAQQQKRIAASLAALSDPLDKYVALSALQDRNEHLFYRVLLDQIEDLMPIVYTPTVGLATQNFSRVFQRGRGLWITPDLRGQIEEVIRYAAGERDVRLIVATDNESILGIGDQGAGGMAISIGKLALYVAGAGIAPHQTLPISLDVGTENSELLDDDLYLGWRHPRLRGQEYDTLIDEFVDAVRTVFPHALLQWEDFRKDNALAILDRHRPALPSFNDDIQGTGAVALAGIFTGLRVTEEPFVDQRVLIYGAGAAGFGIARQIRSAMELTGISKEAALMRVGVIDSRGLLVDDRSISDTYKRELAWPADYARSLGLADVNARDLLGVVQAFEPTVLIGASGQKSAFDEVVVQAMAANVERPLIFPFSNPTDNSEAQPRDVLRWTRGRALIATGSPFAAVDVDGREVQIGQGNNVFIFPGLGLGALEAGAVESHRWHGNGSIRCFGE